jgi:hypothetical protein
MRKMLGTMESRVPLWGCGHRSFIIYRNSHLRSELAALVLIKALVSSLRGLLSSLRGLLRRSLLHWLCRLALSPHHASLQIVLLLSQRSTSHMRRDRRNKCWSGWLPLILSDRTWRVVHDQAAELVLKIGATRKLLGLVIVRHLFDTWAYRAFRIFMILVPTAQMLKNPTK